MAVTLTTTELLAALRLENSAEETAEVTRLLAFSTEAVTKHAPDAPTAAQNEAVRRLAGYLFDQPETSRNAAYANALRNSGAQRMLLPYRVHRAGYSNSDAIVAAQAAVGTVGNPVTDVSYSGDLLTVTYADGATEDFTVAGGSGIDQTARDSAATAQTTAESAENTADTTSEGLETHISQPDDGPAGGLSEGDYQESGAGPCGGGSGIDGELRSVPSLSGRCGGCSTGESGFRLSACGWNISRCHIWAA